jgi:hypothetical protein
MLRRPGRALLPALALILAAQIAPGRARPAIAQVPDPARAMEAAVARLEADGYVARFTAEGEGVVRGVMRYQSSLAYGLFVEDQTGAALEYVFLDPALYDRRRSAEDGTWSGWQRREWHPDLPIEGLIPYHPRLPLELLRGVRDLRVDEAGGQPQVLEGRVSFPEAIAASYEDRLSDAFRGVVESALTPLSIHLDPSDGVTRLVLRAGSSASDAAPPSTFTVDFLTNEAPALSAPSEAKEAAASPFLRAGPVLPVQSLPLMQTGSGDEIELPPFVSTTGAFTARIEPALGGAQYRLWRVKRGRQLLAAVGAVVGGDGLVLPSLALPPGEYVLEVSLPQAVDWTLTITEIPAPTEMAPP